MTTYLIFALGLYMGLAFNNVQSFLGRKWYSYILGILFCITWPAALVYLFYDRIYNFKPKVTK